MTKLGIAIVGLVALVAVVGAVFMMNLQSGGHQETAAVVTVPQATPIAEVAAEAPASDELCGGGSLGVDFGPWGEGSPKAGFTDNDGNWFQSVDFTFDQMCDGHFVNVIVRLSNDRPLETCDECRALIANYEASAIEAAKLSQ